jgi:hypothetical protein
MDSTTARPPGSRREQETGTAPRSDAGLYKESVSETDYSNSPAAQLISSHQVNWWMVHLYFERLRALLGAQRMNFCSVVADGSLGSNYPDPKSHAVSGKSQVSSATTPADMNHIGVRYKCSPFGHSHPARFSRRRTTQCRPPGRPRRPRRRSTHTARPALRPHRRPPVHAAREFQRRNHQPVKHRPAAGGLRSLRRSVPNLRWQLPSRCQQHHSGRLLCAVLHRRIRESHC